MGHDRRWFGHDFPLISTTLPRRTNTDSEPRIPGVPSPVRRTRLLSLAEKAFGSPEVSTGPLALRVRQQIRYVKCRFDRWWDRWVAASDARSSIRQRGPRILIVGTGKCGSTALYFLIKKSLPRKALYGAFEPKNNDAMADVVAHKGGLICKVLTTDWKVSLDPELTRSYHKKIMLVRDPRDILVSSMLYSAWQRRDDFAPVEKEAWLALLEQKERNPAQVSMKSLLENVAIWNPGCDGSIGKLLERFERRLGEFGRVNGWMSEAYVYRYEDMVAGKVMDLESFLGWSLPSEIQVDRGFQRVVRTRAAGSWRQWFTADDEDLLRPYLKSYSILFGYDTPWTLEAVHSIPSEHASGYVRRLFERSS